MEDVERQMKCGKCGHPSFDHHITETKKVKTFNCSKCDCVDYYYYSE